MPPEELAAKVDTLETEKAELELEVAQLRQQVDWFKRNVFGTGKSEKLDALQTRLGIEGDSPVVEPPKQQVSYERKKAKKPRRSAEEQFEALPVAETVELVPAQVKAQPERYKQIGEERTFEVDITPPKLFKREIVRPKFKLIDDRDAPPVIEPSLPRPAVCSYASAGLMAYVVWSKYLHHLPLYRQEKMSAHWGAQLSRKSMADWVGYVADWFEPIYGRMRERLLAGDYLQADETPIRYMDPDLKKGKTTQGYLWLIGRPGSDVVFDWRLTRGHGEATTLLEGFAGLLQSDGYAAYDSFAKNNETVTRIACWAHVRRKFVEAQKESPQAVGHRPAQLHARCARPDGPTWEKRQRSRPPAAFQLVTKWKLIEVQNVTLWKSTSLHHGIHAGDAARTLTLVIYRNLNNFAASARYK